MANVRLSETRKMAWSSPEPLPPAATGCGLDRMVRRGSTVRVRQRASRKTLQMGLSVVCADAAPASRGYETGTFSDARALAGKRGFK
jgi:hypothetical protein